MANKDAVRVKSTGNGFTIEIQHALASRANAELVADCIRVALGCAEKNGCLDSRANLNAACLDSFSAHNQESGCVTTCFGCA